MSEVHTAADLPPEDRDLVYRCCETVSVAPRHIAAWVDQIHCALYESRTWGEFKTKMPSEEYERLFEEQFGESGNGEEPPVDNDPFDSDDIAGVADGDYPAWLAADMGAWIPHDLLLRFGTHAASIINGSYWEIPESHAKPLAGALRARGYKVALSELQYWH